MKLDTTLVQQRGDGKDPHHATAAPLYQTATFAQEHAGIVTLFRIAASLEAANLADQVLQPNDRSILSAPSRSQTRSRR